MRTLDKTAWEILNATADDCENLEQIYRQVCYELVQSPQSGDASQCEYRPLPSAPRLSEISESIHSLVEGGLLAALNEEGGQPCKDCDDLGYVWRAWFCMTPQGRSSWESYEHLASEAR